MEKLTDYQERLENFIEEATLCEALGLRKDSLARLRSQRGFPFIKINERVRVYREQSIVEWLAKNERVIDEAGTE